MSNQAPVQCLSILLLPSMEEWYRSVRTSVMGCILFLLWICLWGIVVIQRNVWSCEEFSCWKSSLVLSHTCPYIRSQLYKRQSSTSESPTVWLCWSSFSCIFFSFYLNHSWNHLRADYWGCLLLSWGTSSKGNCFVKISFHLSFSLLACFSTSSV